MVKESENESRGQVAVSAREFYKGATRPSLPALLGIVLVMGTLLLLCLAALTPDFVGAHAPGYFMVSEKDDYAYISAETLAIRRSKPSGPSVVIVGASGVREACSDVGHIEDRLAETLGHPVNVFLLAAPNLTTWEQTWIAETLLGSFHGILVMDLSPRKMTHGTEFLAGLAKSPRLALPIKGLADELLLAGLEPSRNSGNFFLDNYRFFLARPSATLNIARGPFKAKLHRSGDWRVFNEKQWAAAIERLAAYNRPYRQNSEANLEVIGRMLGRLKTNPDVQAVLIETAQNQRLRDAASEVPELRGWLEQYAADIGVLVREQGVPYWRLDEEAGLTPEDFVDTSHLQSAQAMRRYAEVLADRLAPLLKTQGKDEQNE